MSDVGGGPDGCGRCSHPDVRWYGGGPWLIIHGLDDEAIQVAARVAGQCTDRGVTSRVVRIDTAGRTLLFPHPGLVAILPEVAQGDTTTVRPFARIMVDYRERRKVRLAQMIRDGVPWYEAGVAQAIGRRTLLLDPQARSLLKRFDAQHFLDDGDIDIFSIFWGIPRLGSYTAIPSTGQNILDDAMRQHVRELQRWGINLDDVPKVRRTVDRLRETWENPRYSQLHRPIDGINKNRFSFVLDGIPSRVLGAHAGTAGARESWMADGARTVREAMKALKAEFPEFHTPDGKTRVTQDEFRDMYKSLKILDLQLSDRPAPAPGPGDQPRS